MTSEPRIIARLVSNIITQPGTLMRQEIAVARAEIVEKIVQLTTGSGLLVGADFVGLQY